MKRFAIISGILCAITTTTHAQAKPHAHHNHGIHTPIGLMGAHTHDKGEWMTSYRYSRMNMSGNLNGESDIPASEVLSDFMVAPLSMDMEMHMFGLMYGATDDLTLMVMLPYMEKSMQHVNRMGVHFETNTKGLGDIKLSGTYTLFESELDPNTHQRPYTLLANAGISTPTGSITERGDTPAGNNSKLPYPMQLGSGTVDPVIGVTFLANYGDWGWGAQTNTILRFGENSEGYRLGNEYSATSWLSYQPHEAVTTSIRLEGKTVGDIHGRDTELNANMVPTARADLRGGEIISGYAGVIYAGDKGVLSGQEFSIEFGMPVYQRLDGPQLETDYRLTAGWRFSF